MLGMRQVLKTGCLHFSFPVSPLLFSAACESWMSRFSVQDTSPGRHLERCSTVSMPFILRCSNHTNLAEAVLIFFSNEATVMFPQYTLHPRLVFYFFFPEKEEDMTQRKCDFSLISEQFRPPRAPALTYFHRYAITGSCTEHLNIIVRWKKPPNSKYSEQGRLL